MKIKRRYGFGRNRLMLGGATIAIMAVLGTLPATAVNEIVVTATKRETLLQKTPISITAISSEELERFGYDDLGDFIDRVPSVDFQEGASGQARITIRGTSSPIDNGESRPTVGLYIDDTPITGSVGVAVQPDILTFDSSVEVLRGPQGTLYGEGSVGGTIRFVTNKPNTDGIAARLSGSIGSIEDGGIVYNLKGMANFPILKDKLALRIVGSQSSSEGWIDNPRIGNENVNDYDRYFVRAALRLTPIDHLTIDGSFTFFKSEQDETNRVVSGTVGGLPVVDPAFSGMNDDDYKLYNLTVNYDFGFAELTSSSSYFDRAGQTLGVNPLISSEFFTVFSGSMTETETFTQEVRLVSTGGNMLDWTIGGFYKDEESKIIDGFIDSMPQAFTFAEDDIDSFEQWAVFGELTLNLLDDRLHMTAGARYAEEERSILVDFGPLIFPPFIGPDTEPVFLTQNTRQISPKFSIGFDATDDILLYATAGKGYRSGGFNRGLIGFGLIGVPVEDQEFDEDSVWSYEAGIKSSWFEDNLVANAAFFYLDWQDVQIRELNEISLLSAVRNFGNAHTTGVELEIVATPTEELTLTFGGSYIEAELDNDVEADMGMIIPEGSKLPFAPELSTNATLQYSYPIVAAFDAVFNMSWRFSDSRFNNVTNFVEFDSYHLVGLNAGLRGERWSIIAFADNVTNEEFEMGAITQPGVPPGPITGYVRIINQPRTVGVRASIEF